MITSLKWCSSDLQGRMLRKLKKVLSNIQKKLYKCLHMLLWNVINNLKLDEKIMCVIPGHDFE